MASCAARGACRSVGEINVVSQSGKDALRCPGASLLVPRKSSSSNRLRRSGRNRALSCRSAASDGHGPGAARKPLTDWQQRRIALSLGESLRLGESEGKGYGVFATEDLPANTILIEERPYLMPPPLVANETKQDVYTLFYALMSGSNEGAEGVLGWLFDALHCHHMTLGPKEEMLLKVLPVVRQLAESKLGPDSAKAIAELSDEDLLEVYQKIRTNMQASGGLYIGCAMFNHSCAPNAVAANKSQSDPNYSVMALVDIKEGQEVTIPYIDFSQPVIDRQSSLQAMYGFRCGCPKCTNELDNLDILGGKAWTGASGTL